MKLLSSLLIAANAESACRGEIKDALEEWREEMDAYKNTKNGSCKLYTRPTSHFTRRNRAFEYQKRIPRKMYIFQYGKKLSTTGI